jgi:GNAT superfamily N-acetyltransferase
MLEEHLKECVAFCRMAGAEKVYGTGEGLDSYPEFMSVLEMRGDSRSDPELRACLFPVTAELAGQWREIYNRAMRSVDNAHTLQSREESDLVKKGGAYFIHDCGELLGIGWMEDNKLLAVAGVRKGVGERLMHTLMSLTEGEQMVLEVASTNAPAIRLYEKMGFIPTRVVKTWYSLLG